MKVLGISTSKRKWGNTDLLVYAALKGAAAEGAETRLVRPADLELKPCNGCMRCVFQARDCVIPDRLGEVVEALRWCDAVVFGAPTYVLAPNSVQKAVQDRLIRLSQSHEMRGKPGVALVTAGVPGMEGLALPLVAQSLLFLGVDVIDQFVGLAQGPGEILDRAATLERADRAGRALARGERTYLGEPGSCPLCRLDLVTPTGEGRGVCRICDVEGELKGSAFTPDEGAESRNSRARVDHHFNVRVLPSGPRFKEKLRDYRERAAQFHEGFEE